ncbi:MAG TPA: LysR family transcriptional regulator [Polyangiales bacterium]|nr:LysR family transcriptional regulator [Polyangiales bacterium]
MADIAPFSPALEVRDLRLVLALATAGSTARAAPALHLTQPAISRALVSLEQRLKTKLFERVTRGLEPTAAGRRLLEGAERMLLELSDLEEHVRSPSAAARLRIVCECYTAYHWLPSVLTKLRETLPSFEVELMVEHTLAPVPALEAGEIDAALLTTAAVPRGLLEHALFSDEIVFVMSAQHPLAKRKSLTPQDLRENTLLTSRVPIEESHWFINKVFGRARPKLHFQILPLTEAILDVARAGMGIAILSEWMAGPHLHRGELILKRMAAGPLRRPWRIAYRRESEAAALRLSSLLQNAPPRIRVAG